MCWYYPIQEIWYVEPVGGDDVDSIRYGQVLRCLVCLAELRRLACAVEKGLDSDSRESDQTVVGGGEAARGAGARESL